VQNSLDDCAERSAWAEAVDALAANPARSTRLGTAPRRVLERNHHPAALADRTLELLARLQTEGSLRERPSV
jgi:hypothetical protein